MRVKTVASGGSNSKVRRDKEELISFFQDIMQENEGNLEKIKEMQIILDKVRPRRKKQNIPKIEITCNC